MNNIVEALTDEISETFRHDDALTREDFQNLLFYCPPHVRLTYLGNSFLKKLYTAYSFPLETLTAPSVVSWLGKSSTTSGKGRKVKNVKILSKNGKRSRRQKKPAELRLMRNRNARG